MSGSEEYSSAEDEDYVPSGAEYSEDDVSELVREEAPDSPRPPRGRRSPRRPASRKRKKGGLLLEPDEKEEEKAQQSEEEEEEEEVDNVEQVERNREEEEKRKEDALWASFLSDVGQKPKAVAATQVTHGKKTEEEKSGNKLQEKPKESEKPKDSGKVTITKVFDFAGEEVRVTKEVDSTSKEAKSFLKQQEKWQAAAPAAFPTVSGVKRPSGMSSLLGKIGSKKQKMSTLEKSKLDWENFKEEEGIVEELAIHNRGKDGLSHLFSSQQCPVRHRSGV
ncbi:craniofacial development protein 1 isoform X4 [Rissa tridactyla]|uniref:craniofacial development protein 1 isoform X4 n=1 Tax=Rissa tridactyla TaxID=75485 RepID=UPI0023BA5348|nr:craniofacial development protein 1 isoform X4 [Rissa tridactyla]